jgi:hypothetical protein
MSSTVRIKKKNATDGWFTLKIGNILIDPIYYQNTFPMTQIYPELPYRIWGDMTSFPAS